MAKDIFLFYLTSFISFLQIHLQVSALQQRVSQLMADLDRRQDEYSEMVSGLTKSHEDQLQRQANHLSSVAEQRLSEINVSMVAIFTVKCAVFFYQKFHSFMMIS